jgi:hypothetical protein
MEHELPLKTETSDVPVIERVFLFDPFRTFRLIFYGIGVHGIGMR